MTIGEAIERTIIMATHTWTSIAKKKIRDEERGDRAREKYFRGLRAAEPSIREAAFACMADAYDKASNHGQLPATARQVMYAARPLIQAYTSKPLGKDFDVYFTQGLLPEFMRTHADAATWDVVYDARGHFTEPHTGMTVPLGTVAVRQYLRRVAGGPVVDRVSVPSLSESYPTVGPGDCYQQILFLEKEGFNDLLAAAHIAERFDLAIMSTKGYSNVAARTLLESLSRASVRIFVLHDFDKDGLGILHTLRHDTTRHQFERPPEIIDLGLRLADVTAEQLEHEPVSYSRNVLPALERAGATAAEIAFLQHRRVELNAFTSDRFVAWLERQLQAHGVTKLIPDKALLATAYRRALVRQHINAGLDALAQEAQTVAEAAAIPKTLAAQVADRLAIHSASSWTAAVAAIAKGTKR